MKGGKMIVCKAGNRAGLKCIHKRNLARDVVVCAIEASAEMCVEAQSAIEAIQTKMNLLSVKKEDLS